jgi:hypothetical protein
MYHIILLKCLSIISEIEERFSSTTCSLLLLLRLYHVVIHAHVSAQRLK